MSAYFFSSDSLNLHTSADVAPTAADTVPGGHVSHAAGPTAALYVPGAHAAHAGPPPSLPAPSVPPPPPGPAAV